MISLLYLVLAGVVIILQMVQHKHRLMSLLGVVHSAGSLVITLVLIMNPGRWADDSFILVDHLNLFVMLITGIVFTCASVYAVGYIDSLVRSGDLDKRSLRIFYCSFSLLLLVTTMALFSPNIALFWICAELTTVLSALLIAVLAVKANIDASLKYIFICSTSMLFSFIGIIFIFEAMRNATGEGSLDWKVILGSAGVCDSGMLWIAFVFFFIGFAAKSGIFPFHTWLPEAHAKAPSAVSAVLSGAILNVGMYGIFRMTGIITATAIADQVTVLLFVFAMLTISVACISMLRQTRLKPLIAFSSIENMGFILLGLAIGTPVAVFWSLYHMLGHSVIKSGLFLSAGILHRQYKIPTRTGEDEIGDLFRLQPVAAITLMVGFVALIGTPIFPLFASKISILIEAARISLWIPGIVLVMFAIAAVALIRFYLSIIAERFPEGEGPLPYVAPSWMVAPIIALLIGAALMGIWMVPGEESFLSAAAHEIGFGGLP